MSEGGQQAEARLFTEGKRVVRLAHMRPRDSAFNFLVGKAYEPLYLCQCRARRPCPPYVTNRSNGGNDMKTLNPKKPLAVWGRAAGFARARPADVTPDRLAILTRSRKTG